MGFHEIVAYSREKRDGNFSSFHETQGIERDVKWSEIIGNKQKYAGFHKTKAKFLQWIQGNVSVS